jgi:membrane protein YqaA with SNARE-associated domain
VTARIDVGRVATTDEETAADAPAPQVASAEPPRWDARRGILRIALSLLVFFALMALLAKLFGPRIEGAGQVFVDRFGLAGLAFGTILADAFSLPPPPLFYIVIVATGVGSHLVGMTVISAASMGAGVLGYHLASLLGARPFFRRRIDATRARMEPLFSRYGVWAFAIASATPIPFSFMCYVAGVYRLRYRMLAFICLTRIPRLLVMYWLVRAGWVTGSG